MNEKVEYQVNDLAYHLWISAGREYGRALEFWMMAEQMVWELALASARLSGSAVEVGTAAELTAPTIAAKSVRRIRELAYSMWQAAGAEWGRAVDYWLAAERHITTMLMVPGAVMEPSNAKPLKDELLDTGPADAEPSDVDAGQNTQPVRNRFSAEEYLNAIRRDAYDMWEKAGRQYGENALAFWLEAERQMLHRLEAVAMAHLYVPEPVNRNAEPQPLQPDVSETPPTSERENTAEAAVREPSPFRIRRLKSA